MMAPTPLSSERCCKIDFKQLFATADELFTRTFPSMPLSEDGSIKNSDEVLEDQMASPTILLHAKSEGIFDAEETTCFIHQFFRDIVRQPSCDIIRFNGQLCRSSPYGGLITSAFTGEHVTFSSSMRLCSSILDASKLSPQTIADFRQLRRSDRGFISLVVGQSAHLKHRNFLPWDSREQAIFRALKEYENPHNRTDDGICGRVVPEWIDFAIPKGWLDFCKGKHTRNCGRRTPAKQLQGFRLINCHRDPVVVELCTLEANYVTLSYVWEASPEPSDGWPDVVLHAIEVTRQLGVQYLWVDRYCIDQTNERERAHQIMNMHLIFQQAELTLVAATNDLDGLSGVRRSGSARQFARRAQKKLQIEDITLVTVLDPKKAVAASNWSQRGWTFQEGLLSRRVLVFTDGQLYWNCCGMSERESLYIPAEISHLSDMSQQGRWMTAGIFDRASKGSLRTLPETSDNLTISLSPDEGTTRRIYTEIWGDIMEYSARHLTYDNDSLDGFKGVMQMHRVRAGNNIKFILGLPVSTIPGLDLDLAFAYALSTWSAGYQRSQYRRYHLPSWSWTGWRKASYWAAKYWNYFPGKFSHSQGSTIYSPELRLIAENEDGWVEYSIVSILEATWSFDRFAFLKIAKPYIIHDRRHLFPKRMFDRFLSVHNVEWEEVYTSEDIAVVFTYCDEEDLQTLSFLILRLTDKAWQGTQLWERIGVASLNEIKYWDDEWTLDEWNAFEDKWKSSATLMDLVSLLGLVLSDGDYFIT